MALFENRIPGPSSRLPTIKTSKIVRHAFMPEILPRIRRLGQVFNGFAYLLALIYRSARLLPPGHPMLNAANIGRYGISDVIATAASNLVVRKENTDQIMIFGAIVLALVMIFIQAIVIAFYAIIPTAHASSAPSSGMFSTPTPDDDVVFTFLQQVIGVKDFYNNSNPIGFSAAVAEGMHKMLAFYSTAMMIIAVIIVLYYVITVIGESAQSGTPFGRRFNGLWAPVRLVLALGLLVPLGTGLNAAQYTALYAAKFGSGLATNAWTTFSTALTAPENLTAPPFPKGFTNVGKEMFLYEVCMAAYNQINSTNPDKKMGVIVSAPAAITGISADGIGEIQTFSEVDTGKNLIRVDWTTDKTSSSSSTGVRNAGSASEFSCGHIELAYARPKDGDQYKQIADETIGAYLKALNALATTLRPYAEKYANKYVATGNTLDGPGRDQVTLITDDQLRAAIRTADQSIMTAITQSGSTYKTVVLAALNDNNISKNGWGNAATYYVKLAYANQKVQAIVKESAPEAVLQSSQQQMVDTSYAGTYYKYGWFGGGISSQTANAKISDEILQVVKKADVNVVSKITSTTNPNIPGQEFLSQTWQSDNKLTVFLKDVFAIKELQDLADPDMQSVFPMVLLSNLGNALVTKALIAFGVGSAAGFFNAALGNFIFMFGFLGLSVGFLLFYVLPFMPFIYFFFAVAEWVMSIVEALIGAPLWALAHLRIDGEGMPGQAAMNGYLIMFGIIIRPILILFGLIASYIVFNAGAFYLNKVFGGAVSILRDGNPTNPISIIGYLLIYAIILYNLGLVCFKLIDTIPQQTFRWLGQSNLNFNDGRPDPIGHIGGAATAAGAFVGGNLANSVSGLSSGLGKKVLGSKTGPTGSVKG